MGTKVKKHGLRASHTADVFLDDVRVPGSCLLGGREKLEERLARAREGGDVARPGGDADVRGDAADGRRAGARHRARRVRVRARLRARARAVRAPDHRQPGDRVHARRHEDGDRRRAAARVAGVVDGPQRAHVRERRGLDVQAQGRRGRGVGRPSGRSRSSAATATRASTRSSACTATPRSTRSSRAPPRSSVWWSRERSREDGKSASADSLASSLRERPGEVAHERRRRLDRRAARGAPLARPRAARVLGEPVAGVRGLRRARHHGDRRGAGDPARSER